MKKSFERSSVAWILYDFANTIFSMNVVSTYFALWITVDNNLEDIWVGMANSLSMLLVGIPAIVLIALSKDEFV